MHLNKLKKKYYVLILYITNNKVYYNIIVYQYNTALMPYVISY